MMTEIIYKAHSRTFQDLQELIQVLSRTYFLRLSRPWKTFRTTGLSRICGNPQ